jgi:hypothetical protein
MHSNAIPFSNARVLFVFVSKPIQQDSPFAAVKFETKGVTSRNAPLKHFELVLVDAPELASFASTSDPHSFAEHLNCLPTDSAGCAFENLGGDAMLVAPKAWNDATSVNVYGHLVAFIRGAPDRQVSQLWTLAARTFLERLTSVTEDVDKSVWFSTSGDGVAWLHFRLDERPKYYKYQPFAQET